MDVVGEYGPVTVTVADGGEDGALAAVEEFYILVDYDYTVIDFNLAAGNNLISLYSIPPEDQSVEFIFDSLVYNLTHIHRKEMLRNNWQLNEDQIPMFIKYGYVWRFNGIPKDQRTQLMSQVWTGVGGEYV